MVMDDVFQTLLKFGFKSASYCNHYDEINWFLHGAMLYISFNFMFSIVNKF